MNLRGFMRKKKINNNIVIDMAASVLTTSMIAYALLGKPTSPADNKGKEDGFDITEFFHHTAQSIEDFLQETFSRDETSVTSKYYNNPKIDLPIYPTESFSKNKIKRMLGEDVYKRVTYWKIDGKRSSLLEERLEDVFSSINSVYEALQPGGPVTLEFKTCLFRGESALDPEAKSYSDVIGLAQTERKLFVSYLPQFAYLLDYSDPNKIEQLDNLRKDKVLSAYAGTRYSMDIDEFLMNNDPSYRFLSDKEKQRKIVITYNIGENMYSKAGFDINRVPNGTEENPRKFRDDAIRLSNDVLYWMYGNDQYVSNDTRDSWNNNSNHRKYNSKKPSASKR